MGALPQPVPLGRSLFRRGGGYAGSRRSHRLAEGGTSPATASQHHREARRRGGLTGWRGIRRLAEGSPAGGGYAGSRRAHRLAEGGTSPATASQHHRESRRRGGLTGSRRAHRLAEGGTSPATASQHHRESRSRGRLTVWRGYVGSRALTIPGGGYAGSRRPHPLAEGGTSPATASQHHREARRRKRGVAQPGAQAGDSGC